MPTIFTPEQTAEHLQVTRRTIYTWLREGKLPGRKIGGSWRVSAAALEEFLSQANPQSPPMPDKQATPVALQRGSDSRKGRGR